MRTKTFFLFYIVVFTLVFAGLSLAQDLPCDGSDCDASQQVSQDNAAPPEGQYPAPATAGQSQRPGTEFSPLNPGGITDQTDAIQRAIRQQQEGAARPNAEGGETRRCTGPQCSQVLPPEDKTEFQKFVFTTTSEKLQIYGRNLFKGAPSTFAPVEHIPVPANYVVGPGDELLIRVWGQVDFNSRVRVDRNGEIYLPRIGSINVAGIRYDQLTDYLKNAISRVFKNFDLTVTLGQLRSIQVYVVGQAGRPGAYMVSALSTLVSALFASGGPSVHGSMRHIELRRQNQLVSQFDLYDLLSKGDKSKDVPLLPGDVIYIPPVAKQVAVIGSVNLPAIYEIDDKTSIKDQIALAGGLSTTADGTRVLLERIDDRTTRSVQELKFDDRSLSELLHDGDIVRVFPISPRVEGSVILRGNVAAPGRYPWHEGMRVSDLIPSRESLITREYWMRLNTLSRSPQGWKNPEVKVQLSEQEQGMQDLSESAQNPSAQRVETNELRKEVRSWSDGQLESERTTIVRARSEINWDYAVVQRLNRQDLTSDLITFALGNAIDNKSSADDVVLQSGDVVTIFSQHDLAVPEQKRTKFVWIEGEVKAPGVYRALPGESLRDLVERAGGLTPSAYLYASQFRRLSTRQEQQKQMDELIQAAERDLRSRARLVSASLNPEDKLAGQQELQYEQAAIEKLRNVKPTGRIVLEAKPDDSQVSAVPALALEDGDELIIPPRPGTIGVVGSVYNPSSFLYQPQNTVSSYVHFAGGGTRESDPGRMFIVRASGSVVSAQMHRSIWAGSFGNTKVFPGDTIVMPEKIKTTSVLKNIRDWMNALGQYAVTAALIATR